MPILLAKDHYEFLIKYSIAPDLLVPLFSRIPRQRENTKGSWFTKVKERHRGPNSRRGVSIYSAGPNLPLQTIFEIGNTGKSDAFSVMKKKRQKHDKLIERISSQAASKSQENSGPAPKTEGSQGAVMAEEEDIESAFATVIGGRKSQKRKKRGENSGSEASPEKKKKAKPDSFKDEEFYIPHFSSDFHSEKG
ncbi:unnamed protein product [Ixodes pacificus]